MRSHIEYGRLFVRLYVLMVALAFGLGTAILIGGAERFGGPSLTGAVELVDWIPGFPPWGFWAMLFLVYGAALILSMGRPIAVHVLRVGMVVYLFLVSGLILAPFSEPKASLTGIVVYSAIFGCHAILSDHLAGHGWTEC